MSNSQSGSRMIQDERDKNKALEPEAAEESFDGRKGASSWKEFQKFEKEVRFKIRTEIDSITTRGEESIKRVKDSVGIQPGEFEKVKAEQEIRIQEIRLEGLKLGKKAQEIVNILAKEMEEKIKKRESLKGSSWKEALIQDEISKQIIKIQKMYEYFLDDTEKIRKKIDELLFDMEDNLRESSIKKVEEVL